MSGLELPVVTVSNEKTGKLALDPKVFGAPLAPQLLHAEVRRQLAARRGGTHSSKNRSAVSGGGAKPWRQKGTGRARQGSSRSPQWSGGGAVFGPVPRSHGHGLPKKVRRGALRSAVSLRVSEGAVTLVDALELDEFKTRRVVSILRDLGLEGCSVLIVLDRPEPRAECSARNLPRVSVVLAAGLNVFDVLRHEKLLLTRAAVQAVEERLGERGGERAS